MIGSAPPDPSTNWVIRLRPEGLLLPRPAADRPMGGARESVPVRLDRTNYWASTVQFGSARCRLAIPESVTRFRLIMSSRRRVSVVRSAKPTDVTNVLLMSRCRELLPASTSDTSLRYADLLTMNRQRAQSRNMLEVS